MPFWCIHVSVTLLLHTNLVDSVATLHVRNYYNSM
jgi:hypothetical protein